MATNIQSGVRQAVSELVRNLFQMQKRCADAWTAYFTATGVERQHAKNMYDALNKAVSDLADLIRQIDCCEDERKPRTS